MIPDVCVELGLLGWVVDPSSRTVLSELSVDTDGGVELEWLGWVGGPSLGTVLWELSEGTGVVCVGNGLCGKVRAPSGRAVV